MKSLYPLNKLQSFFTLVLFFFAFSFLIPSISLSKSPDEFVIKLPGDFQDNHPLGADPRPQIANYVTKLPPGESSGNYGSEQGYVNVIIYDPSTVGMTAEDFFEYLLQQEQNTCSLSPLPLSDLCFYGPSRSAPYYSNLLACVGKKIVWAQFFNPKGKLNPETFAQKLLEKVAQSESLKADPLSAWIERERDIILQLERKLAELQRQADSFSHTNSTKLQPSPPLPPITDEQEVSLTPELNIPEILLRHDQQMAKLQEQIRSLSQQIATKKRWLQTVSNPANSARIRSLVSMSQEEFFRQKQEAQRLVQHYSSAAQDAQKRLQNAERQKSLTAAEVGKKLSGGYPQNWIALRPSNTENPSVNYVDTETLVDQMRKAADSADAAAVEESGYSKIAEEQNLELRLIHFAELLRQGNAVSPNPP